MLESWHLICSTHSSRPGLSGLEKWHNTMWNLIQTERPNHGPLSRTPSLSSTSTRNGLARVER
eukprot:5815638-Prorocentrum_lima.AAC.1